MEITLQRLPSTSESTTGALSIDNTTECHTLEDVCRPAGEKVYGKTAIPAGRYQVVITRSNRFKVLMPLLIGVPGFAGVRIHAGNTAADTDGCILVGKSTGTNAVYQSRDAYRALYAKIEAAIEKGGKVWLTVKNGAAAVPPAPVAKPVASVAKPVAKTPAPLKQAA